MRNQVFKKLFSVLLALIMVAGLLPASAMAGGWGAMDVDTTPELTETEQPAEPTPAQGEPVAEPTPEQGEPTAEPVPTQGEPTAEPAPTQGEPTDEGIMPANVMPVQAETEINNVTKTKSVPLPDGTFYRIVHLDCGRKYFSEAQIEQIIDYAYKYGYTHVELAFGNDGLRFLLDDMEVIANGTTYTSENVTSAIKAGNKAFYDAGANELSEEEMGRIIAYAKGKGIGIIPMFDAPGHLQTVIRAMMTLDITFTKCTTFTIGGKEYSIPTTSGSSENWAINPTYAEGVNFVQALMQKYITYFAGKGCTMFNIAADECGFTSMSTKTYTAYAKLVNSMAAMVQNAGMTALAFNDGIYHKNLTTDVEFDTNIAVCYWDATTTKYAPAATLAAQGFKIINTHNKWYYVIGAQDKGWYGATWSINNMNGTGASDCIANKCDFTDGGYQTKYGCMNAIWCDTPSNGTNMTTIEEHIKALSVVEYNKTFFNQVEAPKTPAVTVSDENKTVKEVTKAADNTYKVVLKKATGGTAESQTLQLNVANGAEGATYTWTSDNEDVATVEKGLVTFKGAAGTVTITATPVSATRSINETAAYSITLNVEVEGDVKLEEETITITVGQDATRKQDGKAEITSDYDATVVTISTEVKNVPGSTGKPTKVTTLVSGSKYIISDDNGNYLKRNGTSLSNVSSPDEATEWTVKKNDNGWLISDGNYYYLSYYNDNNGWGLYVRTNSNSFVTWGYDSNGLRYYTQYNNAYYYLKYNNGWTVSYGNSGSVATAWEKGEATPGGEQTTITFHGVKEGETTVVVGNVKYNIKVTKEDVTNVAALPVQLWFTNCDIEVDLNAYTGGQTTGEFVQGSWQDNKKPYYVSVDVNTAYGPNGVELAKVLPGTMLRYENSNTYWIQKYSGKDQKELVLWSGRVHNKADSNIQLISGTDYSNSGSEFMYIRYYGGTWAVSADRNKWDAVTGTGSITSASNCTQQLAAYYMMRTGITKEIFTDVADWGFVSSDNDYSKQINTGYYVMLDFAVKQDGMEREPSKFPVDKTTFVFHCTPNDASGSVKRDSSGNYYRQLNNFRGMNTSGYEIYMVTVTMTEDGASNTIGNTGSYDYNGEEQIVWAIDEETKTKSRLNEYTAITSGDNTYSGCKIGGDPYVRGVEVYNQHGALITYYIRRITQHGDLIVRYFDVTSGYDKALQFHKYTIGVKDADMDKFKDTIKLDDPWKKNLIDGNVTNDKDHEVWVSADLSTMPDIDPQYRYASNYVCIRVERKEEGKEVWLYYTFSSDVTFVVDFGLPLVIKPTDMSAELENATITSASVDSETTYADIVVDNTNFNITYKLKEMISSRDTIKVSYTGKNKDNGNIGKTSYTVTIIPATNVYYEDSFAKFYDKSGNEQTSCSPSTANDEVGIWYIDGQEKTATQALEALGTKENVYGYDPAYNNCTKFSMGSARKVTVNGTGYAQAKFTFKGTGFDVISLTDNNSGAITVEVLDSEGNTAYTATDKKKVFYLVNNYYGYTYDETTRQWTASPDNTNNAIYQVPVIKVRDLNYGEYTAVISVDYAKVFDKTGDSKYSFWLDAVRVYDPAGSDLDKDYVKDSEVKPIYVEVRKALIGQGGFTPNGSGLTNGAVFIDGKSTGASIDEYKNFGPNHEVYLASNQAIAFRIVADKQPTTVQIGVKLANGSSGKLTLSGSNAKFAAYGGVDANDTLTLNTATDMYYALNGITWTKEDNGSQKSNVIVLTNTGDNSIVSITNVKCTYASITENTTDAVTLAISYDDALMAVDAVNNAITPVEPEPEPEPEKTFEPEQFEASWSRNVMQGRKATLTVKTSEDVEAITVDGQTIRSYRTRTERVGFGRRAKRITYREFTYSMVAQESADFSVTAINAEGTESEAITARLTVKTRPNSMRDMWDWFKGWF